MDQLWAPWRMAYLGESTPEPGCLFCNKASNHNDVADYIVHRGTKCFVMLNLYPYNSGHLLVVPYQHTGRLDRVECGEELFATMQVAIHALEEAMAPEGFNVGINQGTVSGAGIPDHVHLHVVPRWKGDTNFMPVLADTKVMPELLSSTADTLRSIFEKLTMKG
ncbi:MAG: HIT domain-containing protein [Chloroflexota bacterium]